MTTPSTSSSSPLCLVTGASGYIASHVVKKLLEHGFRVRGTVRSLQDPAKSSHLRSLFPTLELVEADLLRDGSFDQAVIGVDFVLHTASPFQLVVEDPQKDLIEPALNGTRNVLSAVSKHGASTVKRVIVTSSAAAILAKRPQDYVYSENDWNYDSKIDFEPYRFSKRIAEEAAWEWSKESGIPVVTINPTLVLGPPLSSRVDSFSVATVKGLLSGFFKETGTKPVCFGCVDVRDVAEAHLQAVIRPLVASGSKPDGKPETAARGEGEVGIGGRYLVTSEVGYSPLQLGRILAENGFEKYPLPDKEESPVTYVPHLSREKAKKELGIQFTPIETSLKDMANSLFDLGILTRL